MRLEYALILLVLAVTVASAVVIVLLVNVLAEQNRRLLAAVVAETPKDYGIIANLDARREPTTAEQAHQDQVEAEKRNAEQSMADQLRGLGYDPHQIGT